MKYSIIIATYNHANDLLKPCLDAILINTTMTDTEIIIVANGCKDNTREVVESYAHPNIKLLWYDEPLGYSGANNKGIEVATGEYLILLNNDAFLLGQEKDTWIRMLEEPFLKNPKCGLSGPLKTYSEPAGHNFIIFFCVMIKKEVMNLLGGLNEEYGKGGGEDTEFSILAERLGYEVACCDVQEWSEEIMLHVGHFPIYHKGEATVHDTSLVPDWDDVFIRNSLLLAKKFNPSWYDNKMNEKTQADKYNSYLKQFDFLEKEQEERLYEEIFINNEYDITFEDMKDREIIDIGANCGMFSMKSVMMGAKKVVSVEPVQKTKDKFQSFVDRANFNDKITILKNAVSDIEGKEITISHNPNSGSNSIYNVKDDCELVSTITLSKLMQYVNGNNILLKIDCEGSEYDIILNANSEDMNRITKIVIEIHSDIHPIYKGKNIIESKLESFGFNKIKEDQMFYWEQDEFGNRFNMTELPGNVQVWEK